MGPNGLGTPALAISPTENQRKIHFPAVFAVYSFNCVADQLRVGFRVHFVLWIYALPFFVWVVLNLNRSFYHSASAHSVSVLILRAIEVHVLRPHTVRQRKTRTKIANVYVKQK